MDPYPWHLLRGQAQHRSCKSIQKAAVDADVLPGDGLVTRTQPDAGDGFDDITGRLSGNAQAGFAELHPRSRNGPIQRIDPT